MKRGSAKNAGPAITDAYAISGATISLACEARAYSPAVRLSPAIACTIVTPPRAPRSSAGVIPGVRCT